MHNLADKHILIGISGGIAAYKVPEVVRRCQAQGAKVRVVMTASASQFITPLTLQTISGYPVASDPFAPFAQNGMDHIELARWADCLLIAPATANRIAKMAQGLADDLLGTLYLAATCPTVIAPAMNKHMWEHPATQDNLRLLHNRGIHCIGPDSGEQACGDEGSGRMSEPTEIVQALAGLLIGTHTQPLKHRILISAGPTYEDIDPIRFIGNRSSGKMGYALATAARSLGATVTLVSGPVNLSPPAGIAVHAVRSAEDMQQKISKFLPQHDLFISAAAVADYRCTTIASQKIKKNTGTPTLILEKTADILKGAVILNPHAFIVGFAAETEQHKENALKKLAEKNLDMIIANPVGNIDSDLGMDSDLNQADVYWKTGSKTFPKMLKTDLATQLLTLILEHYDEKNPAKST